MQPDNQVPNNPTPGPTPPQPPTSQLPPVMPTPTAPAPASPFPPTTPSPSGHQIEDYDFIVNNSKSKAAGANAVISFGPNSKIARALVVVAGLIVLLIIFHLFEILLSNTPFNEGDYITVLQQQDEILHILSTDITNSAQAQQGLNLNNQSFVPTANLSVASAQSQLMTYMTNNHVKVNKKVLGLKISSAVDTQLTNVLTTNNFNQLLDQTMQTELQTYENDLITAYKTSTGVKGRALLKSEYAGAQLLIKQINLANS